VDITPEEETEALGTDLKGIAPSDELTADDIDEDDDESTQKKKREEITKTQAILSTKLGLRYIKRQIEELFEIKEAQEWMRASNKVEFLFKLLKELKSTGHKVLIFSKTKILLNLVEQIIKQETEYQYRRLDGSVPINQRDRICQEFNKNEEIFCFLLTNQVSGVGLNLVSADRAIIIDPDWNPANDNQSIDRIYRIGQKRDVIVYRLISCGSVEEHIYKRQVFKNSLSKATLEDGTDNIMKYFDD
jgi:SNF2 family DNA or RNA helicase